MLPKPIYRIAWRYLDVKEPKGLNKKSQSRTDDAAERNKKDGEKIIVNAKGERENKIIQQQSKKILQREPIKVKVAFKHQLTRHIRNMLDINSLTSIEISRLTNNRLQNIFSAPKHPKIDRTIKVNKNIEMCERSLILWGICQQF